MTPTGKATRFLAAYLAGTLPAFAADLDEKLAPCLACHGTQGQSELENVPSLGAQTAPYTVIQLFMFQLSGGLVAPADTDTGLTFVTKSNVGPYLSTPTRFEGSTTAQKLVTRSGPINNPMGTTST